MLASRDQPDLQLQPDNEAIAPPEPPDPRLPPLEFSSTSPLSHNSVMLADSVSSQIARGIDNGNRAKWNDDQTRIFIHILLIEAVKCTLEIVNIHENITVF